MYTDKKKKRWPWLLLAALIIALAIALPDWVAGVTDRDVAEQSAQALKSAVQRSALQCYVVEGIYPPNLAYLEEHYGLQVNHTKFTVIYNTFASNLPPDIRVIPQE